MAHTTEMSEPNHPNNGHRPPPAGQRTSLPGSLATLDRPRVIFSTQPEADTLLHALRAPGVLELLAAQGYGVALALAWLDEPRAQAARLLNERAISAVAWLNLPPEEGFAFNLQNYPRAIDCYRAFHAWAQEWGLRFEAVGLSIEPPFGDVGQDERRGLRALARRLWLARENILYPSAYAAYVELIATIHHDGYEVHTYQMPVIADDRRAGTTLIQRALDIVDLPSDMDVLMCSSSVPIDLLGNDLGGALVASYGTNADAIGVGSVGEGEPEADGRAPLDWPALQRDLLLAAQHTDTVYLFSLEDCVERGLLPRVAALDWELPARAAIGRRVLIGVLRGLLFMLLVAGRFGLTTLAWTGWALAIALWVRGRRMRQNQ
jgi:hypothetical protein